MANEDIIDDEDMDRLTEAVGSLGTLLTPRSSMVDMNKGRRLSRASVKFFQNETSTRNLSLASASSGATGISTRNLVASLTDGCDHGLIDSDGKVRDGECIVLFCAHHMSLRKP